MERNSEFYRAKDKDLASHPQPGYPEAAEWWYHDFVLNNGYSMQIMFWIGQSSASVWLHVCDPDGNLTTVMPVFHPSAVVASTEILDVRIGDNRMYGKFPKYEIHFRSGDMGADLVFECITQAVMEPPDGVYVGREQCPATPEYMANVFRPRCKVTGKLTVSGREIPVQGEGYGDHQWTNYYFPFPLHTWYWGKIYFPKHTIVWWDGLLTQTFGFQRAKWLYALKGEKLIEYLSNADMYVESSDLEVDPESGVTYPRKMVFMIDEQKIKGTATYTVKHIVFKHMPPRLPPGWTGWRCYFRYLSDCHSQFEIEGEKIEADTREVHEIGV